MELVSTSCCGVREIEYLQDAGTPDDALKIFCEQYFDKYEEGPRQDGCAHVMFTEVTKAEEGGQKVDYGKKFAAVIAKYKLGTVIATRPSINPAHGAKGARHWVKGYLWTVNKAALRKWAKANDCFPEKEVESNYYDNLYGW